MDVFDDIAGLRAHLAPWRQAGETIALVPTMGALHAGHLALVAEARARGTRVVATIFVNPTQFGDPSDLEKYPRDDAGDLAKFEAAGVDVVLMPSVEAIYPNGAETIVETERLANMLHGLVRPGHFRGVTTVVAKLFNIIQPDIACFGEKDYQQLQVIRTMVRDLHFPIEIIGVPTQRESDGLAMSSRNVRLSPEDRAAGLVLSRALAHAETLAAEGTTIEALTAAIRAMIEAEPRASLKGLDITEARSLNPVSGPLTGPIAIMLSAEFGGVLLLDQREVSP